MTVETSARAIEPQIDNAYVLEPILRRGYTHATFYTLLAAEKIIKRQQGAEARQVNAVQLDALVNALNPALRWLSTTFGNEPLRNALLPKLCQKVNHYARLRQIL